jgi:hypothetical protein
LTIFTVSIKHKEPGVNAGQPYCIIQTHNIISHIIVPELGKIFRNLLFKSKVLYRVHTTTPLEPTVGQLKSQSALLHPISLVEKMVQIHKYILYEACRPT